MERLGPVCAAAALGWLALAAAPARAHQDDVVLPLPAPDRLFSAQGPGFLTASDGQADLAVYPWRGAGYHRWHGRVRGDVALGQLSEDDLVRLGLSMQTVADDRNDISFRLVRLYYDALLAYERRLGPGVFYGGYRHRCSHGADAAVEGRVLIRSGPELGYRAELAWGGLSLRLHGFGHVTALGQNDDYDYKPRALLGGAGELRYRTGDVTLLASAGLGLALVGRHPDWTHTVFDPWRGLRLAPLPAGALGVVVSGRAADLRVLLHAQRILDTGIGLEADPTSLLSLQVGFVY
ncbi:MAG: hypothetical protein PVI30_10605 [Myxococcales bacterium]